MRTGEAVTIDGVTYRRDGDGWRQTGSAWEPLVGPRIRALLDRVAQLEALSLATPTPDARARVVTDEMVEAALSEYDCARANKWFPEAAMRSALERALAATTRGEG